MPDNPLLSRAERKLFRRAVAGTRPLAGPRDGGAAAQLSDVGPAPDPADGDLFRRAMSGVDALQVDRVPHYQHRRPPVPHQAQREREAVLVEMISGEFDPVEIETGEELWFARPGLQHTALRKLRRGRVSVGAELDLHGLIVAEAHQAVDGFIRHSRQRNIRCVRIIHGKGNGSLHKRPVLKGKVDVWLRRRDDVLAFSSARPEDGGTGAVYVLLKSL